MAAAQPPPPTPAPVPVVGLQFCQPSSVVLDIKEECSFSGGDFSISGVDNSISMKVEGRADLRSTRVLRDAAGFPIIIMKRKTSSWSDRWNIYRGDGDDQKDFLFTVRRSHKFTLRTELDVFLAINTTEQHCDLKVKQKGLFHRSYEFYLGDSNTVVALMSRLHGLKSMLKSTFRATVYPNMDYVFVIAITVILNEMYNEIS